MPSEQSIPDQGFRPLTDIFIEHIGGVEGFWYLYLTIVIFAAITYKLGFARKLPLLKSIVVYIFLALGCFILTFFSEGLPMLEVLVVSALVLGIYRYRLAQERKRRNREGVESNT
ncbi:YlaH-like family protein [Salinibacillus xinjiangensis]|uniref:YlaH-like protein n=1 Tax=Salinibacillus xinjiangensis TaxID=1229268 RepID=A0A6G1X3K9_9BACI|nr:YlaH-like family protein [Salinibacillus xinjiangensis]MRG85544.1 hypothetical protein [Salinibacillus xinjiangensis]